MAQLKDTIVSGSLRATDTIYTTTLQTQIINALTASDSATYGPGTNDLVLKSNGTSVYWATLGGASGYSVTDSSSASAIGTGTSLVTERDVYYGLPIINNVHNYNSSTTIYAPTAGGTANYVLMGNGTTAAPIWKTPKDALNIMINALDTGSSNLTSNDYVITQYVGGGTTTTTYHRRPASALRVGGLLTARKLKVALDSTTDVTFDGTADLTSIPVNGTLPIANGGTGATTAAGIRENLGLSNALHFIGTTTTTMSDGLATANITVNNATHTPIAGDVVLYEDSEYVWTGSAWERLGRDSSFKTTLTAITKPSAATNKWVSAIGLDANGVISIDYGTLDTSGNWSGLAAKATADADGNTISSTYIKKAIGTTKGDIIYWSAKDTPARLGISTDGYFLTITEGVPAWSALPIATTSAVGVVKIGTGLDVEADGTISITYGTAENTALEGNTIVNKVKQSSSTTNVAYKLLLTTEASPTSGNDYETLYSTNLAYNPSTKALVTGGTIDGLTLTAATTGFTIKGGTTTKTLTVNETYTLAAACAKGVTDSTSASAISTGTNLVTERDVYYGLPTINGAHTYTSSTTLFAPTSVGTSGYFLKSSGSGAPSWSTLPTASTGTAGIMKVGTGLSASSGTVSVSYGTSASTALQGNATLVTLNGTNKTAASVASFYAPTSAGTSGQYLKSSGSGAPTWDNLPTLSATSNGSGNVVTAISASNHAITYTLGTISTVSAQIIRW